MALQIHNSENHKNNFPISHKDYQQMWKEFHQHDWKLEKDNTYYREKFVSFGLSKKETVKVKFEDGLYLSEEDTLLNKNHSKNSLKLMKIVSSCMQISYYNNYYNYWKYKYNYFQGKTKRIYFTS